MRDLLDGLSASDGAFLLTLMTQGPMRARRVDAHHDEYECGCCRVYHGPIDAMTLSRIVRCEVHAEPFGLEFMQ